MMQDSLLKVQGLQVEFNSRRGKAMVLNGVDLEIHQGQTLCLVGESGCGKSMTALALLQLIPSPPGKISGGQVFFHGEDLLRATQERMQEVRGNRISMIFQEPMTSLNPAFTVGEQIVEGLMRHRPLNHVQAQARALEMLQKVRIPAPEKRMDDYPHQLSGGMRQRVMIAMALSCEPQLLIADEPTTALDVTIQAQILDLMRSLQKETDTAIILITHDLGVVAEMADQVVVMYAGQVVEQAPVQALFDTPQHPYTVGLLGSIARLDAQQERLASIEGQVPNPLHRPQGCAFAQRCPFVQDRCKTEKPQLRDLTQGHWSACLRAPLKADILMPYAKH